MKLKTNELTSSALDWAVAKAVYTLHKDALHDGVVRPGWWVVGYYQHDANEWFPLWLFNPSTNWAQGGPIGEREKYDVGYLSRLGEWVCYRRNRSVDDTVLNAAFGPTSLIATMRCLAASKLGNEIDVPEELMGVQNQELIL